jgi:hypothetical protein
LKKIINNKNVNSLVWKLAASKNEKEYNDCLDEIGVISEKTNSYLMEIEWSTFVDAYFTGKRFGHYTSNISESLNSKIIAERESWPFQAFRGLIRRDIALYVDRKKKAHNIKTNLHPSISQQLRKDLAFSRKSYNIVQTGDRFFEVIGCVTK